MLRLRRTVRFAINPPGTGVTSGSPKGRGYNGYAASPPMAGLGRHYEIDVECRGEPDDASCYLLDIKDIDRAVREAAIPVIAAACDRTPEIEPGQILPDLAGRVAGLLDGRVERVRWRLSPFYSVECAMSQKDFVVLRQRFDFAASHRLHNPALSDAENRRMFGKCNNPTGHGHNYQVEPAVAVKISSGGQAFTLLDLERLTDAVVIERFDHRHLNSDVPEFTPPRGLIPSVENIARVCFDLLAPEVRAASGGAAELREVTVWETDRTCATYPAP
ncbi:MAG: 6-carboxytetrahydropterin synthase [Phycisphaerales bacterium]|nr:6-carboxytetrahydropterin synthase [Phycisphaerales bacterium]